MSLSAAVIDALVATGATAEQLAAAMKADLADREQRLADKRAKDAARQRKSRMSRDVTVTPRDSADPSPNEYISNPHPDNPSPKGDIPLAKKSKPKAVADVEIPDWMPTEQWAAFIEMRKAMRGVPFTAAAAEGIVSELTKFRDQGHDIAAILRNAVMKGYRGVFAPDKPAGPPPAKPMSPEELEKAADRFARDGDAELAATYRGEAARRRRSTGPPQAIGSVVSRIVRQAEAAR